MDQDKKKLLNFPERVVGSESLESCGEKLANGLNPKRSRVVMCESQAQAQTPEVESELRVSAIPLQAGVSQARRRLRMLIPERNWKICDREKSRSRVSCAEHGGSSAWGCSPRGPRAELRLFQPLPCSH